MGSATSPEATRSRREPALDGLRGVAAAIVLFHHVVLAGSPSIATAYRQSDFSAVPLAVRAVSFLWAGPAFVIVFFVLSGFVLALPAARGRAFDPGSYYPRRLLRLYAPVWGAFLVAAVLHLAQTDTASGAASSWLNLHPGVPTLAENSHDVTLMATRNFGLLTVLWSLHWEVLFSLALPLFVFVARRSRRWHAPLALLMLAVIFAGGPRGGGAFMLYMPTFFLGTLLAFNRPLLGRLSPRLATWMALAAVPLLGFPHWLAPADAPATGVAAVLIAMGAVMAVVGALAAPGVRKALERPFSQWLGSRSYSLYLVHEPVVVALAFGLALPGFPILLPAAGLAVVLVTEAFFRLVEQPSQELARRAGAAAGAALRTSGARPDPVLVADGT